MGRMNLKNINLEKDFLHLARIALSGRPQDASVLLHRFSKKYNQEIPGLTEGINALLVEAPTRATPLRKQMETPMPVDADSRLHLMRVEPNPQLDHEPVFQTEVLTSLNSVISERGRLSDLQKAGLNPTRTCLLVGPPGVGKTMSAYWIARELNKPLIILDLAAVMNSYLGRTGANLRHVLEYAKSIDCVLLLDELDAIAKRRDDTSEVGELKRLVTVLIQQLDDWPASGLLLAATNHPDLLDPAIWRRFEMKVNFKIPEANEIEIFVERSLREILPKSSKWAKILAIAFLGKSYSDIDSLIKSARRLSIVNRTSVESQLIQLIAPECLGRSDKIEIASELYSAGVLSQRAIQHMFGVSRDTIRSKIKKAEDSTIAKEK